MFWPISFFDGPISIITTMIGTEITPLTIALQPGPHRVDLDDADRRADAGGGDDDQIEAASLAKARDRPAFQPNSSLTA